MSMEQNEIDRLGRLIAETAKAQTSAAGGTPICDANAVDLSEAISIQTLPSGLRKFVTKYVPLHIAQELELASRQPVSQGDGWQDIASAPVGGEYFLAAYKFQGKWFHVIGRQTQAGKFLCWPGQHRYDPTHWQPLPNPPGKS